MHTILHIFVLRKHIGHAFKSMGLPDIDSATCDNRVSVVARSKLTSSLEVESNSAFNILLSLVSFRLGFHWDRCIWQNGQLGPDPLKCGLQCGQLGENKGRVCSKRRRFGIRTSINADAKLTRRWAGSQEGQIHWFVCGCLGNTLCLRCFNRRQYRFELSDHRIVSRVFLSQRPIEFLRLKQLLALRMDSLGCRCVCRRAEREALTHSALVYTLSLELHATAKTSTQSSSHTS